MAVKCFLMYEIGVVKEKKTKNARCNYFSVIQLFSSEALRCPLSC